MMLNTILSARAMKRCATRLRRLGLARGFLPLLLLGAFAASAQPPAPLGTPAVYKHAGSRDLKLWVLAPPAHSAADHAPAIVFFHGGGWTGGSASAFNRQSQYLAGRGLVAIQVDYRLLKPRVKEPLTVPIQDAKSSLRWVRSHAAELGIDPHRIAAAGGSAGGQLTLFLGLMDGIDDPADDLHVSPRPDAMVLFNPVIDLGPGSTAAGRGGADYKQVSPVYHVHAGAPPMIVMSGSADKLVPAASLLAFGEALKNVGVRCEIVIYPGQGHAFFNAGKSFYATLEQTDRFLGSLHWLQGPPDLAAIHRLPATMGPSGQ